MKISPMGAEMIHMDSWTDMPKQKVLLHLWEYA